VPPAFEAQVVVIAPFSELSYEQTAWRDTIVFVEQGEVELEWETGSRMHCLRGDVMYLIGLHLRVLSNPGAEPVILIAVSRRPAGNS
jgi:hypothetical protein